MKNKHGHHGGAWKVAYADFVTAMMALFLVLWLTAQDEKIKEAVERAFRHPFSSMTKQSVGIMPNENEQRSRDQKGNFDSAAVVELAMLRRLNQDLLRSLENMEDDPSQRSIELEMTPEGLRISVFDRSHRPIFDRQSWTFTQYGDWVFSTLAWEVARYRGFTVELEGHTERGHPPLRPDYGDWELSADRANAARRKLLEHGVEPGQLRKVAGFADTQPVAGHRPDDEINRRVTVMLKLPDPKA
ncbi:MAG: OmpA family protein [Verrucomicrobiales bacterium]|nr:OmpA family protein [Verrucomicrobiales bacterium]